MKKDKKEIQTIPTEVESSASLVLSSLTRSIESGSLQPEQLSAILDAQERVLDRQAKQDFAIAMADCQKEMPAILKTEYNPQTKSSFEGLDGLNLVLIPIITGHGFSISFGTDDCPKEDMIRVTAELTHRGGWSKDYHYDLPYDMCGIKGMQNKTKIHASGSTLKYGRRYLLKLIFNLTTVDEVDDDGNGATAEYINEEQLEKFNLSIENKQIDLSMFLDYMGAKSLDKILVSDIKKAEHAIKSAKGKK